MEEDLEESRGSYRALVLKKKKKMMMKCVNVDGEKLIQTDVDRDR